MRMTLPCGSVSLMSQAVPVGYRSVAGGARREQG